MGFKIFPLHMYMAHQTHQGDLGYTRTEPLATLDWFRPFCFRHFLLLISVKQKNRNPIFTI